MRACDCGKDVRLGAMRIRVNGKQGVTHYIVHTDDRRVCVPGDWTCVAMKPYSKLDAEKPWKMLMERWNEREAA